ncbi:MAG: hypothetical protein LH615_11295 [Ferruginibacter sp.]|nr:hypothetical protein [Ferruginibacter sp.]
MANPQKPSYTTITIAVGPPVTFNKLIRWVVPVAVNLNHTSSSGAFNIPQDGGGKPVVAVALTVVPAVTTPQLKLGFTGKVTAAPHSSFTGGGGGVPTHILKLALVPTTAVVYKHVHSKWHPALSLPGLLNW